MPVRKLLWNFSMKKLLPYILIIIFLVSFVVPVHFSLADTVCQQGQVMSPDGNSCVSDKTYNLLAPLPDGNGGTMNTFDPTGDNKIGVYLNLIIKLFIGICAVLAVIMIVWGGIEYMTSELISGKEAGRERITNAIFGLILALGAWTLLYQINPNLLNTNLSSLKDVTVEIDLKSEDIPQGCKNGTCGGFAEGADWATTTGEQPTPMAPYMSTNKQECKKVGDQNCTSTLGLDISTAKTTQWGCGCVLNITGGTETWLHGAGTSHKPGSSTVDLGFSTQLNNYITQKGTPGKNGNNSIYIIGDIKYFKESDHWHVYK
jgi:hypothetical protein